MSDFTALDNAITAIANEVIKKAITKTRIADVLTMLRNHISEIELTPGQNAEVRVNGTMFQWKLSGAASWTDLFDLSALQGDDGAAGPYFVYRVFNNEVIQIRLNNAAPGDPWINLVFLEDITGPAGSPDTAAQIRDKINTLEGEERFAVSILKDFVTAVLEQIQTNVPIANRKNFLLAGNQYSIASVIDLSTSSIISFETTATHAGEFQIVSSELTDKVLKPIYHRLSILRQGRDKNWRKMYHTSEYVPAILVDPAVLAWGTKPSWLIFQGDPYLVGVANLNIMTATFYREYEVSAGVWEYDVVVLENKAITGGNMDVAPPDLDTLILIDFNQPDSPVEPFSVPNLSFYGDILVPEVLNPLLGIQFDDLGGGNHALRRTASDNNIPNRAHVRIPTNAQTAELFRTTQFTIVGRVRLPDESTDADIGIFGNQNAAGEIGWGIQKRSAANSNRLRLRIGTGAGAAVNITASSGEWLRGANYYAFAIKFRFTEGSPHTREHKMWLKSSQAGLPLTLIDDVSTTSAFLLNAFSGLDISLDSFLAAPSSTRNNSQDYLRWSRAFDDDAPILAELNLIDP